MSHFTLLNKQNFCCSWKEVRAPLSFISQVYHWIDLLAYLIGLAASIGLFELNIIFVEIFLTAWDYQL